MARSRLPFDTALPAPPNSRATSAAALPAIAHMVAWRAATSASAVPARAFSLASASAFVKAAPLPAATRASIFASAMRALPAAAPAFPRRAMSAAPAFKAPQPAEETPNTDGSTSPSTGKKHLSIKELFAKYGAVVVVTYLTIYVVVLATLFVIINFTPLSLPADDILAWATGLSFVPQSIKDRVNGMAEGASPTYLNFAAAWVLAKFTEPLRMLLTVMVTPKVAEKVAKVRAARAFMPLVLVPALAGHKWREEGAEEGKM